MLPLRSKARSVTRRPDSVRKVRLKTSSGVLTLCSRIPSMPAARSPEATFDKESAFESLSELSDSREHLSRSVCEVGCSSTLGFPPDFSSFDFWTSQADSMYEGVVDFSDTFSRCEDLAILDQVPALLPGIDLDCPWSPTISANLQSDPYSQSVHSSGVDEEINFGCSWKFPLELEEDVFQATANCDIVSTGGAGDRDGHSMIDNYLVENSPPLCTNSEHLNSNMLVYAPNRYIEEAYIFQSSRSSVIATENSEAGRTTSSKLLEEDKSRTRRRVLRKITMEDKKSILHSNVPKFPSVTEVRDDAEEARETCEDGRDNDRHHHGKRLLTTGMRRPNLFKISPPSSEKPSMTELELHEQVTRDQGKKADTVTGRRLLDPVYCSDSTGESDYSLHKSPDRGPRQISWAANRERRDDTSLTGCASPLKGFPVHCSKVTMATKLSTNLLFSRKRAEVHVGPRISTVTRSLQRHGSPKLRKFKRTPSDSLEIREFRRSTPECPEFSTFRRSLPLCTKPVNFRETNHQDQDVVQGKKSARRLVRLRRAPLPQHSIDTLQAWLNENLSMPYPSRDEKEDLMLQSGLTLAQIQNWLGNARQKLKLNNCRSIKDLSESSPEDMNRSKRKRPYPAKMQI